jgi:hypothetical protein
MVARVRLELLKPTPPVQAKLCSNESTFGAKARPPRVAMCGIFV